MNYKQMQFVFKDSYVTWEGYMYRNNSRPFVSRSLIPAFILFLNVENIASSTRPSQSSTLPRALKPFPRGTTSPSGEIIATMSVVSTVSITSPASVSLVAVANFNLCIASKHFCKCLCTACGFFVYFTTSNVTNSPSHFYSFLTSDNINRRAFNPAFSSFSRYLS